MLTSHELLSGKGEQECDEGAVNAELLDYAVLNWSICRQLCVLSSELHEAPLC